MATIDFSQLTVEERLDLIDRIWESLDAEVAPASEAMMVELDRRDASFEEDRRNAIAWEVLRDRLRVSRA